MRFIDLTTKYNITREKLKMGISVGCIMLVSLISAVGTKTILDAQAEADKQRRTEEALRLAAIATAVDETSESSEETTSSSETVAVSVVTEATSESSVTEETSESSASEETTTTEATTTSQIGETELYMTVYAAEDLNLRTGPGTEYDLVRTLEAGDAIDVVAVTDNGWYRTYNGNYVASGLTTSTPPVSPSTVPQTESTTAATTTARQTEAPAPPPETQSGGSTTCTITFYGPQPLGDGSYSTTTATGTTCSQGRTCAADWSIYPPGTTIYIENDPLGGDGYYTVEDCGPGVTGNHIDIYVDDVSSYSTTSRTVSVA